MNGRDTIKLLLLLALIGLGTLLAFARRSDDQIRSYSIERPQPGDRMLGAILPHGNQAWFFKLTGPNGVVEAQVPAFRKLIQSIQFRGAQPDWELPSGWRELPGGQMRFATLEVDTGGSPLECSVTVLPVMESDPTAYLLANINRWRDQLKLNRISPTELPTETEQLKLAGSDHVATLINFAGELSGGGMGGMGAAPFAGGGASPTRPPVSPAGKTTDDDTLKYDVPATWKPAALETSRQGISVRRAAAFEVSEGEQSVEITVTKLPASAVLMNVNRWRQQAGLDSWTAEQFEQEKKPIEFGGAPADYLQFFGSEQAILGVIALRDGVAWFAKLQGTPELAGRERENFEKFVRSIRWE